MDPGLAAVNRGEVGGVPLLWLQAALHAHCSESRCAAPLGLLLAMGPGRLVKIRHP